MIRVTAIIDTLDDEGGSTLLITGHANATVCAGVSALWHTLLLGYEQMAKENPKQLSFQQVTKKKAATRRK